MEQGKDDEVWVFAGQWEEMRGFSGERRAIVKYL